MRSTIKMVAVLIAALALVAAACGSTSDTADEQLAEEFIEAVSGGDVDINLSGDGDDMTIEMETEDGSVSIGAGSELPDGLEIPVPDGGDVMTAVTAGEIISVSLIYDQARYDELVSFYENWTSGSGGEWDTQAMTIDIGEGSQRSTIFTSETGDSFIMVGDCFSLESVGEEFDAACVTINAGG